MGQARRLCPHAIVVRPRFERYVEVSEQVMDILHGASPLVEPLSIDEAFVDVTGSRRLLGEGHEIGAMLRRRIAEEVGLTASVGVAPNKFLAKLASDLRKPDALVVVEPGREMAFLDPLPISKLMGVGPVAERRLHDLGIRTIGQLSAMPVDVLAARLGSWGPELHELAHGRDHRPVTPEHQARSIGHEQTFGHDVTDPEQVLAVLLLQVEAAARRLRKHGLSARTVSLKIRMPDYETFSRSCTLEAPTDRTDVLWKAARDVFEHWRTKEGFRPVRLIGVHASGLARGNAEQLNLFEGGEASEVDRATDAIVEKFGRGAIMRARGLSQVREKRSRWGPLKPDDDGQGS